MEGTSRATAVIFGGWCMLRPSRARNGVATALGRGKAAKAVNLLLIEDNPTVGRALAKSLRAQGHQVTLAQSCADARATTGKNDVGIFDLSLPDGDGIELCEQLLKEGRIRGALFCSGSIDDLLIDRAQQTARVVSKEASFWELCRAIAAAGSAGFE